MHHKYERHDLVARSDHACKACSLSEEIAQTAGVRIRVASVVAPPADHLILDPHRHYDP